MAEDSPHGARPCPAEERVGGREACESTQGGRQSARAARFDAKRLTLRPVGAHGLTKHGELSDRGRRAHPRVKLHRLPRRSGTIFSLPESLGIPGWSVPAQIVTRRHPVVEASPPMGITGAQQIGLPGTSEQDRPRPRRQQSLVARTKKEKRKKKLGGGGYRSPCLSHAKRSLYHLSYTPEINVSREKTSLRK